MPNVLLSGPAGAGKSAEAQRLLEVAAVPTVVVDFQEILASLLFIRRDPETGRYPERNASQSYALALAESIRQRAISAAEEAEIEVIATNSTGNPSRRAFLLERLGARASETILDPGLDVVRERLSVDGILSAQCQEAINRWYLQVG